MSLPISRRSWFVRLLAGDAGIDPDTRAVSDVRQDLFRESSFTGKGIYDVDAFERAMAGRLPENTILSHDLSEACHARSALVSDMEFYEAHPSRYNADIDQSVSGIDKSSLSDVPFWQWQHDLGPASALPAVWSSVPAWDSITARPILPDAKETAFRCAALGAGVLQRDRACVTKGEQATQVERHRRMTWEAFRRGWNGWGFYSYYAPRGNAWNDLDEESTDYLLVYPGPRGPIPTRASESVRERWKDFRLLTLLQQRAAAEPKVGTEIAAIMQAYAANESLTSLRLKALRVAESFRFL